VRPAASGVSGGGNQERLIMTNRSKLEALRASKLAVELSPEQCGVLSDLIDFRDLKAGDVLVREGTRDAHLYVIVSGAVGVVKSAGGSGETTLLTLADGAFVDELGFMDGTAHYASLVALGDTCVFGLERHKLESLLATHPEIVYRVMRAIIRAVHQIQRQLSRHSVERSNNIHEQTGRH
jgi:CRP/FNR family transcriptional regulator, cyclic AMP receptor protein